MGIARSTFYDKPAPQDDTAIASLNVAAFAASDVGFHSAV